MNDQPRLVPFHPDPFNKPEIGCIVRYETRTGIPIELAYPDARTALEQILEHFSETHDLYWSCLADDIDFVGAPVEGVTGTNVTLEDILWFADHGMLSPDDILSGWAYRIRAGYVVSPHQMVLYGEGVTGETSIPELALTETLRICLGVKATIHGL